jgi:uncharacterized damage-inducible protein DinB
MNGTDVLLSVLDDAYSGKSWQGPNLKGSIRGLSAMEATWRPGPGRHNIWELVAHVAYWEYAVKRRLLNEKPGLFPSKGSNWFSRRQNLTDEAWKAEKRLLEEIHRDLRRAVASLDPGKLNKKAPGGKLSYAKIVYGAAAHDIYHTGQINLIKRLMRS